MIQAQRQRVESAVTELIDDMDKTHLRKMQVNSSYYNSPHKWFKHDLNSNVFPLIMTDRNAFVCGKVLPGQHIKRGQRAALRRSVLGPHDPSAELCAAWAGRISGPPPTLRHGEHWNPWIIIRLYSLYICMMNMYDPQQCNDDVKVKMPPSPSEEQISKYTDQFERCAIQCVDKHVGLIPSLMKTMKAVLAKGPESIPNHS